MSEGTIVERLAAQRTLLVDVVRQIDTAITAFGGTVSANGNGNGHAPVKGSGNWISAASPAKLARWRRKISRSQKAARARRRQTEPQFTEAL